MSAPICDAIRQHLRLEFEFNGKRRVVEPYCHGASARNTEVLRAIEVGGQGNPSTFGFGKLWTVAKMSDVRLGQPFEPRDPNYNPNDGAMNVIHCRV